MKATTLSSLSILAVVASAFLIPVSVGAAGVALTLTGVVAILLADYHRPAPAATPRAEVIRFPAARPALARDRQAA
jgi:hypothetical protein